MYFVSIFIHRFSWIHTYCKEYIQYVQNNTHKYLYIYSYKKHDSELDSVNQVQFPTCPRVGKAAQI